MSTQATAPAPANPVNPPAAPDAAVAPSQAVVTTSFLPHPRAAAITLCAAAFVVLYTGGFWLLKGTSPGYSPGGAAATVAILLAVALLLAFPSLILDDSPENGGQPSTMRMLSLFIVTTFCVMVLYTGWNQHEIPSLQNQGNWVWLVTAAIGGKALQAYAEMHK